MKNKILMWLLLLLPMVSMSQKVAFDAKPGTTVVKGKIGNLNSPKQLWIYMGNENWDSVVVTNGEFEYKKTTLLPAYGAIMVKYKPYYPNNNASSPFFSDMELKSIFFEDGTLTIRSAVDSLKNRSATYSGSKIQDQQESYLRDYRLIAAREKQYAAKFNQATPAQLQSAVFLQNYEKQTAGIQKSMDSLTAAQIKKAPESLVSLMALHEFFRNRKDQITPERAKALYAMFSPEFRGSEAGKNTLAAVEAIGKKEEEVKVIEVGTQAPVFSQADPNGKSIALTDFKGKYVLIDFWASWCVPCRKVNPDLVKVFEKLKSAQFTILGVSLDENKEKWLKAIADDRLNWTHVSDLQGWKNAVSKMYGIQGIPQNVLIDPNGKVLAKNLGVQDLEKTLSSLIQNK